MPSLPPGSDWERTSWTSRGSASPCRVISNSREPSRTAKSPPSEVFSTVTEVWLHAGERFAGSAVRTRPRSRRSVAEATFFLSDSFIWQARWGRRAPRGGIPAPAMLRLERAQPHFGHRPQAAPAPQVAHPGPGSRQAALTSPGPLRLQGTAPGSCPCQAAGHRRRLQPMGGPCSWGDRVHTAAEPPRRSQRRSRTRSTSSVLGISTPSFAWRSFTWQLPPSNSWLPAMTARANPRRSAYLSWAPSLRGSG